MFTLSEQAIKEFQQICLKKYGIVMPFREAEKYAIKFLQFFKLIFKPIKDNYEK